MFLILKVNNEIDFFCRLHVLRKHSPVFPLSVTEIINKSTGNSSLSTPLPNVARLDFLYTNLTLDIMSNAKNSRSRT